MPNYKQLAFLFFFTTIMLLATDSQIERQSRKSLLSFFDIVVEEGSQVSDSAPSTLLDTVESARITIASFLGESAQALESKANSNKGIMSLLLTICAYITYFLKFISNYIITFYPFVIFIFYIVFSSNFFKRNEFEVGNL
jgi:hypothetical protein